MALLPRRSHLQMRWFVMNRTPRAAVAAVVATFVVVACGGSKNNSTSGTLPTPATTATTSTTAPKPAYQGRLLVSLTTPPSSVAQLTSGSLDPVALGPVTTPAEGSTISVSPDGTRFSWDDGTLTTLGSTAVTHLPFVKSVASSSFSADSKRLAYSNGNGQEAVYDLATETAHIVLQTPCADYTAPSAEVVTLCGAAGPAVWIDPTTLLVSHFVGTLPATLSSPAGPKANTDSLITTTGRVVTNFASDAAPTQASGTTIVLGDATWVDLDQVRAGAAAPKPLPPNTVDGSLSPDGSRVVTSSGQQWQLENLRTGAPQLLATVAPDQAGQSPTSVKVVWSPDGQFFAVQLQSTPVDPQSIVVVPVSSTTSGGVAGTIGADASLLAWVAAASATPPSPATTAPPATGTTTPPAAPTAAPTTTAPPAAGFVATFPGTQDQTTRSFVVGNPWRLSWTVHADIPPLVEIDDQAGNILDYIDTSEAANGSRVFHQAGTFTLKVSVYGDTTYTLTVTNGG